MLSNTFLTRFIVLCFMVLVGFSIAKSIYSASIIGFLLAITSLVAGIYFMYLLARVKEEQSEQQ